MTIDAHGKSNSIQNLKITNLHRHLLFESSEDPALLAGVDDADNEDTSLAAVHGNNTSLAGVTVTINTIVTHNDNDSDTESNHNSINPNEPNDNSSKASVHSTGSHIPVQGTASELPQYPPDGIELTEVETPVPLLH